MSRVLGLDVGDRRIGIAISDELGITSRGILTLNRTNIKADTQKLLDIIIENKCSAVIVGLPLNISGSDSVQTVKVRRFALKLQNKLQSSSMGDIKVILYDERYSTLAAEETMQEMGLKNAKKRDIIDQQAAAVILDGWLRENERENKTE